MSKRLEHYHGFKDLVKSTKPIPDCYSLDVATTVHLYPYGPRLRCPIKYWIDVSYERPISGAFRLCHQTPSREYDEKYSQWAIDVQKEVGTNRDDIAKQLNAYFVEDPPTMWNAPKRSRYALFMLLYWGYYLNTPESGNMAGVTSCEVFQFSQSSPICVILDLLEFLDSHTPGGEEFEIPSKQSMILHGVLHNCSALRGGSLERSFGVGTDGELCYERFRELISRLRGSDKFNYF